jgi:hypothetical protein
MRRPPRSSDSCLNRTLGADRQLVIRGFAVDQVFARRRHGVFIGDLRPGTGNFFINGEQQSNFVQPFSAELLRCRNLGCDDSLRVAGSSAVDEFVVFA